MRFARANPCVVFWLLARWRWRWRCLCRTGKPTHPPSARLTTSTPLPQSRYRQGEGVPLSLVLHPPAIHPRLAICPCCSARCAVRGTGCMQEHSYLTYVVHRWRGGQYFCIRTELRTGRGRHSGRRIPAFPIETRKAGRLFAYLGPWHCVAEHSGDLDLRFFAGSMFISTARTRYSTSLLTLTATSSSIPKHPWTGEPTVSQPSRATA